MGIRRPAEQDSEPLGAIDLTSLAMPSARGEMPVSGPNDGTGRMMAALDRQARADGLELTPPDERVSGAARKLAAARALAGLPSGRARPAPRSSVPAEVPMMLRPDPAQGVPSSILRLDPLPKPRATVPGGSVEAPMALRPDYGASAPASIVALRDLPKPRATVPPAADATAKPSASSVPPSGDSPEIANPFPETADPTVAFAPLPPDSPSGAADGVAKASPDAPTRPESLPTWLLRIGDKFQADVTGRKADYSVADRLDAEAAERQARFDADRADARARAAYPDAAKDLGDKATREDIRSWLASRIADRRVGAAEASAKADLLRAQPKLEKATDPRVLEATLDGLKAKAERDRAQAEAARRGPAARPPSQITPYQAFQMNRSLNADTTRIAESEGKIRGVAAAIGELRKELPADDAGLPSRAALALDKAPGLVNAALAPVASATGIVDKEEQKRAQRYNYLVERVQTLQGLMESGLTLTKPEQDRLARAYGNAIGGDPTKVRFALDEMDEILAQHAGALKASNPEAWARYASQNPDAVDADKLRARRTGAPAPTTAAPAPRTDAGRPTEALLDLGPYGNAGVMEMPPPGIPGPGNVVTKGGKRYRKLEGGGWEEIIDG
jgi:hypothetical protein